MLHAKAASPQISEACELQRGPSTRSLPWTALTGNTGKGIPGNVAEPSQVDAFQSHHKMHASNILKRTANWLRTCTRGQVARVQVTSAVDLLFQSPGAASFGSLALSVFVCTAMMEVIPAS